jgi:hypothetical protein
MRVKMERPKLAERRTITVKNRKRLNGEGEVWLLIAPGPKIEDMSLLTGDQSLNELRSEILAAKPADEIPAGATTKLLVRAVVSCSNLLKTCDVTAISADRAMIAARRDLLYRPAGANPP